MKLPQTDLEQSAENGCAAVFLVAIIVFSAALISLVSQALILFVDCT